jgi:CcmD family protein
MSGITVVYVVFAIVIAAIFGYTFLIARRQRDIEAEMDELKSLVAGKRGKG